MAWIGLALSAWSAVDSADAQRKMAADRKEMFDYQAAVAKVNEQISEQNAKYAEQKGEAQAQIRKMQSNQMSSSAKAALAASGVRLDESTPANIESDIALIGSMDVATIRNNAMREAYGYRVVGQGFGAQAALDAMSGVNARRAGAFGSSTSLISGAGTVADRWSRYRTSAYS